MANTNRYRTNHAGKTARMDVLSNGDVVLVGVGGGNVGIATEEPLSRLTVANGYIWVVNAEGTGEVLRLGSAWGEAAVWNVGDSGRPLRIGNEYDNDIAFYKNADDPNTPAMIIKDTGKVGIGVGISDIGSADLTVHKANSATIPHVVDVNAVVELTSGQNATNFWFNVEEEGTNATFGFATNGVIRHAMTYVVPANVLVLTNQGSMGAPTEGLMIGGDGKVGIKTYEPLTQLDIEGDFALRSFNFTAVNGYNNNINIGGYSFIRISGPTTSAFITGIAGGVNGKIVILYNLTNVQIIIRHENTASLAQNRIITNTGGSITLSGAGACTLIYDSTTQRWRVISYAT